MICSIGKLLWVECFSGWKSSVPRTVGRWECGWRSPFHRSRYSTAAASTTTLYMTVPSWTPRWCRAGCSTATSSWCWTPPTQVQAGWWWRYSGGEKGRLPPAPWLRRQVSSSKLELTITHRHTVSSVKLHQSVGQGGWRIICNTHSGIVQPWTKMRYRYVSLALTAASLAGKGDSQANWEIFHRKLIVSKIRIINRISRQINSGSRQLQ